MNHWVIAPVLLPLASGIALIALTRQSLLMQRALSAGATIASVFIAVGLLITANDGDYRVYVLGAWPPPFGIVLVLDRLSALLLMLTALVAACSVIYATQGADREGRNFHALFQFQLMGLNGAFLTGDLFNLFVFFEVLLIASYALLLHGGDASRTRAGFHYVVLNLIGSTLFLMACGLLYGVLGTLNMADLALKISQAPAPDAVPLRAGGLLLLVVFALKAAIFPLYFWLPGAYTAASAPVAALFVIMTKVGVYAIIRVFTLVFGAHAGVAAEVANAWLLPLALATLIAGVLGALASDRLRGLVTYLIIVSIGMLMAAVGLFSVPGLSAALVYLIHTTLITAGLFLLSHVIGAQRNGMEDHLAVATPLSQPLVLGLLFLVGAAAIVGLPPFSGFLGKLMILIAARDDPAIAWIWSIVLTASLLALIAMSRAGSIVFWKSTESQWCNLPRFAACASAASIAPTGALLSCSVLLVALGEPVTRFAGAAAEQLMNPRDYVMGVLDDTATAAPFTEER